jgi:hypothetical protein
LIVAFTVCAAVVGGCADDSDDDAANPVDARTSTTRSVAQRVRDDFGVLHRSTIAEVPDLVALFYHHPDGWAVEDTSLDRGATWYRHAWYGWEFDDVVAPDDFTVRYVPTVENPDCVPIGQPLVLHVTGRAERNGGLELSGEYQPGSLHTVRTVCPGTIDDWQSVCGASSGLGAPTAQP